MTSCGLHTKSTYPFTSFALLHISILGAYHTAITKITAGKKVRRQNKKVRYYFLINLINVLAGHHLFQLLRYMINEMVTWIKRNKSAEEAFSSRNTKIYVYKNSPMRQFARDYGLLTDFQDCNPATLKIIQNCC